MFTKPKNIVSEKKHGFTLIELIVVIIIVGILAAVGISQYSLTVEKSRLAEAKTRIGTMRQLAYEYYLNNGTLTGLTDSDIGGSWTCTTNGFYACRMGSPPSTTVDLIADRCTSSGKTPNATRRYLFRLQFTPSTGESRWACSYADDNSACFGYPAP